MEMRFLIVNDDGINLWYCDFCPPIGFVFDYSIQHGLDRSNIMPDALEIWDKMDGKRFVVTSHGAEVRNYNGKQTVIPWATVEEEK